MKLSIYTFIKDGIFYDFHCEAMLRHHLPLADEIIVNEGYSTDDTYERITAIDPKIKVFRTVWDRSDPATWHIKFKNRARVECSGDWCILLDCDEFIPEWQFEPLRQTLAAASADVFPMRYINFYGNYKVFHGNPSRHLWPEVKWTIHRNLPHLTIWGDGSNVRSTQGDPPEPASSAFCDCHHFGVVRNPARLRQKWRTQVMQHDARRPRWDWVPSVVFDVLPYDWKDPEFVADLQVYDGPYIKAVRDDPDEFTRDNMLLYEMLSAKVQRAEC